MIVPDVKVEPHHHHRRRTGSCKTFSSSTSTADDACADIEIENRFSIKNAFG